MLQVTEYKKHQLLAKLLFIGLPTILILYPLLGYWNAAFEVPNSEILIQLSYFGVGLIASMLFHALGFRLVPSFLILLLVLYAVYKGVDASAIGEFDVFFITVQFIVFATLISTGWLVGWGILKVKQFPIVLAAIILIIYIFQIGQADFWLEVRHTEKMASLFWQHFGPVFLYTFTTICFSVFINHTTSTPKVFWLSLGKRSLFLVVFLVALYLVVAIAKIIFFEEKLKNFTQNKNDSGSSSMLQKVPNEDGKEGEENYQLNDKLSMSGNNQKENILLFAAYIDNYFDDKTTPNPLYLVSYYYSKYDTLTESFERDALTPDKDYFSPSVGSVPMYHTLTDSSVLAFGKDEEFKKTISFDIYNKNLDPNFFVGPTHSYFVQPVAVEPLYRKEFRNAYRGKSSTSEWNSAYFVYNVTDINILSFQSIRNEQLKKYNDYSNVDSAFMKYYTEMPTAPLFKKIDSLAKAITLNAPTAIDKILAIKAYFQKRDAQGKKIFKYSDNPGEPNLPGSSKLDYFLFKTKNGYCAYYASATLYMLRSLGVPARVVGGFLTEDRSADKNRGWYWYYADQAHAWVQIYFPGIGWLDFDTTIDNDDARESEQTDGTPPLQPTKATFASFGVFESIDTTSKKGVFVMTTAMLQDNNVTIHPLKVAVDLSITQVIKDTAQLGIQSLSTTDSVTLVSYSPAFLRITLADSARLSQLLPTPLPIDEVHVLPQPKGPKINDGTATQNATTWLVLTLFLGLILAITLVLSLPYLLYRRLVSKLKNAEGNNIVVAGYKAQRWLYKFFVIEQVVTDLQLFQKIDENYGTKSVQDLGIYHSLKYGQVAPSDSQQYRQELLKTLKMIQNNTPKRRAFKNWLQLSKVFK